MAGAQERTGHVSREAPSLAPGSRVGGRQSGRDRSAPKSSCSGAATQPRRWQYIGLVQESKQANTHSPRCQILAHAVRFLWFQTPTPAPEEWQPPDLQDVNCLARLDGILRRQIALGLCDATVAHKRLMRPRCCDEAVVVIFGRPASGAAQHRRRSVTGSLHSSYGRPTWHYRLQAAMRGNPLSVARYGAGPPSAGSSLAASSRPWVAMGSRSVGSEPKLRIGHLSCLIPRISARPMHHGIGAARDRQAGAPRQGPERR
ncbi:hypothetical protein Purlil1_5648 [Purpureocillium lilacinum]|uniref:Uncharacterized protein n=1 Tax=Purpureocillium lilacinum TaxID=33203 RepID=A0ABR0C170_PURLI|nr:hypothetical protein Purlil1_5648 [Purpureocillium lilacinum]